MCEGFALTFLLTFFVKKKSKTAGRPGLIELKLDNGHQDIRIERELTKFLD